MKKKKLSLHWQIIIGLILGLVFGISAIYIEGGKEFTLDWVQPVGDIFMNGLKMIAVPIVITSIIIGIANIGNVSRLSRIGGKTIAIYLVTTTVAITIGLITVNIIKPGKILPAETREKLIELYGGEVSDRVSQAEQLKDSGPLQPLEDMVTDNIFASTIDNGKLLQVVFFAVIFGVALLQVPKKKRRPVVKFFDGLNEVIIKIIGFIMLIAPYGVFALMASLLVELAGNNPDEVFNILYAELWYSLNVIIGLAIMLLIIYPALFKIFTKVKYTDFFKGIRPAQLLAFSTSSSSATLPVTMKQVEEELGVSEEVSSFVLPLGATVNMDGTSLYQAVAAVFIAQAYNMELSLTQQLMIVFTALLASIGSAGVPGAGILMLVIVLQSVGIPAEGLVLIFAPDRILDMCRTTVNVTGDASVTMVVASTEGELPEGLIRKPIQDIFSGNETN